jgi:exosortase
VIAVRAGLFGVQVLLLPPLLWLAIRAALGRIQARRNLFAVAYLYFAMPLWAAINPVLQWGTVYVVRGMLRVAGVPAYFFGNSVQIPSGTFEIAGGCSGLHFFVVALAIAALMGELRNDDWRGRFKLLLLAGVLAVVTNWIRVFTIILAGHFTHMQHTLVADSHYFYGWVLFAVAMIVFFLLERRMPLPSPGEPAAPDRAPAGSRGWRTQSLAFTTVVVCGLAMLQWLSARPAQATPEPVPQLPGWVQGEARTSWQPLVSGADASIRSAYRSGDAYVIERHVYLFMSQRQGKELGGYGDDPSGGATVTRSWRQAVGPLEAVVHEVRDTSDAHWLIATTYRVGDRHYDTPLRAQLHHALGSVARLRSVPSAVELWRAPCSPDCTTAMQQLERLFAAANPRGLKP